MKNVKIGDLEEIKKEIETMPTFDVIISNPPYQDANNKSTYTNLWSKFFNLSIEILKNDGYMGMIIPKTWLAVKNENRKTDNNKVKENIKKFAYYINIDECAKYFENIGSTFSYIMIAKNKKDNKCTIETDFGATDIDDTSILSRVPKNLNSISLSIFKKVYSKEFFVSENNIGLIGKMITAEEKETDIENVYKYPVQYAFSTIKYSNMEHRLQKNKKVIFPNQNPKNYPIYDDGKMAPANRGSVYLVENDIQGNNMVNYIKSKIMQFVISDQRFHHGLLNTEVINCIPKVDLNRTWSDEELYEYFELTEEEIDYIENNVK